jgi:hypothetical protein
MSSCNRRGERGCVPYRNGRIHCINGQWFYAVRGPRLRGPFEHQEDAEKAMVKELRGGTH